MTQEPLYPEGHPKRIEQDSQRINTDAPSLSKNKKKNDRTLHTSSEPEIEKPPEDNNDVSISDAETQSGNEHSSSDNENDNDDVHEDAQPDNDKEPDNDVEIEPAIDLDNPQPKNKRFDKRDFVARKYGKEREPWVQKPMPFPPKPSKKKDEEVFERFAEMLRLVFFVLV
jgi:hypothetical protein